jgi:hypothetical protein
LAFWRGWSASLLRAFAQAAIAGSVSDLSGVPVPGVAVEATSDALIENTRTTLTATVPPRR